MDLAFLQRVAEGAAAEGAAVVARRFGQAGTTPELKERAGDWVTSVDRESETAIRATLERNTSDIPVLAEEGGGAGGPRHWAVDPLMAPRTSCSASPWWPSRWPSWWKDGRRWRPFGLPCSA